MKNILKFSSLTFLFLLSIDCRAQTTAMDFQGVDCNNNPVHLFSDLDAGKAVMLIYYMANCGTGPPVAQKISAQPTATEESPTAKKLRELDSLLAQSLITKDEYDKKRKEIIDGM